MRTKSMTNQHQSPKIASCDAMMRFPLMRTTINLDDELLAQAKALCGVEDRGALLKEALRALIERESARRLARLGGTEPQLRNIPRRREPAA
jgi:Arc/MetJ family transcription regulator